MKTYLLIEELQEDDEEILYLESGPYQSFLPQIGDIITVNNAPEKRLGHGPVWEVKGQYKVIARSYDVYSYAGTDHEMTCSLTVVKIDA
jgi:hypothetical protein